MLITFLILHCKKDPLWQKRLRVQKNQMPGIKKTTARRATQITPMQLELLDMFAHKQLSNKEIEEIKDLISDYFLEKARDELEELAEQQNWDLKEKSKEWGKEKLRTPYRRDSNS